MAGLSIARRQKAWLKGVACGATGRGACLYSVAKLREIYQKGVIHGRTNIDTPYVKGVLAQEQSKYQARQAKQPRTARRAPARDRGFGPGPRGFSPRGPRGPERRGNW
jgi:hypothetical protein